MKKISKAAAALSLGIACAMPVMAQDSSTTQSTTTPATTQSMGAGPSDMQRVEVDNDRDMGWIGLLGLAGLLGLRRKKHDDRHDHMRVNPTR